MLSYIRFVIKLSVTGYFIMEQLSMLIKKMNLKNLLFFAAHSFSFKIWIALKS